LNLIAVRRDETTQAVPRLSIECSGLSFALTRQPAIKFIRFLIRFRSLESAR
jgi:hypothetical protein